MLIEIQDVRAQPPARQIEGGPGTGAGFEKQIGHRDAGQFTTLIRRLSRQPAVAFRPVENPGEHVAGQPIEGDEMAQSPWSTDNVGINVQLVRRLVGGEADIAIGPGDAMRRPELGLQVGEQGQHRRLHLIFVLASVRLEVGLVVVQAQA